MFYLALGGWAALVLSVAGCILTALLAAWIWFVVSLVVLIVTVVIGFSDFKIFWIG